MKEHEQNAAETIDKQRRDPLTTPASQSSLVQKDADEMANKASETERRADDDNGIFDKI